MSDTGLSEQIATLREQIAAAEVKIEDHRSRKSAQPVSNESGSKGELAELIEARDSMLNRLTRLESCQRGFHP